MAANVVDPPGLIVKLRKLLDCYCK